MSKVCKDCIEEGRPSRPLAAGAPGPRCATHWRQERRRVKAARHDRDVAKHYGITGDQYRMLLAIQGGKCAICQVATGKTKMLAVDHDHQTGAVRGILCGPCNKDVVGRLGIEALQRAVAYLKNPPGKVLIQRQCDCVLGDEGIPHVHTVDCWRLT